MEDKLTIFYNKRNGRIKELCGGEQDMSWFGDEAQDYELIFDYVVVEYDAYIIENYMNMEIIDNELKIKERSIPDRYL